MDDAEDTEPTRGSEADASDPAALQTRVAVLEAENRQLRDEHARAKQATYRQTALALLAVGVLGLIGGVAFADARSVLFALGGTGVFAGALTYVLTPERFVTASVGSRVYQALRADRDAMVGELGIGGDPVYVPVDDGRLFVPRREGAPLPDGDELTDLFVVPEDSEHGGVAFCPTGAPLFDEFDTTRSRALDATPHAVAPVLADALVELFELADGVDHDVDAETNRVTFELAGAGLSDPTGIDHPIASFLAVGLARTLDATVRVDVRDDPLTVTCRYDPTWADPSDETATTDAAPTLRERDASAGG